MSEPKIVAFPGPFQGLNTQRSTQPKQLSLFGEREEHANYISFIDLDELEQSDFFSVITANAVSAVLDIRAAPVFRRPHFNHSEVMGYFSEHHVSYFEYAVAASDNQGQGRFDIARSVNRGRTIGLTICIYDESSRNRGWLDAARLTLRRSSLFTAELSPRALAGYT